LTLSDLEIPLLRTLSRSFNRVEAGIHSDPHVLALTHVRKRGRMAFGPFRVPSFGSFHPARGSERAEADGHPEGRRGNHHPLTSAMWIQVEDAVRWGVWLGRHIC
jgi:hypothetical protein